MNELQQNQELKNAQSKHDEEYAWIRMGDCSEYEKYDDLDPIIDILNDAGVSDIDQVRYGIISPHYQEANYISLYWGSIDLSFRRDLSNEEFDYIEKSLARK